MTIYSSGKSCWQRNKEGLPQDNASPTTVGEDSLAVETPEPAKEVKPANTDIKKSANTDIKKSANTDIKKSADKIK